MELRELSARSGVPVPTIKYYLREDLLRSGTDSPGGRADYDEAHLRRLGLIRLLVEVHRLPLGRVRDLVGAIDGGAPAWSMTLPSMTVDPDVPLDEVDRFLDGLPGKPGRDGPERILLARALRDLRRVRGDVDVSVFRPHARAAGWLADEETAEVREEPEAAVVAAAAFDAALAALRALARVGARS
jgi:DNA-binding transcriptional MerR regulator